MVNTTQELTFLQFLGYPTFAVAVRDCHTDFKVLGLRNDVIELEIVRTIAPHTGLAELNEGPLSGPRAPRSLVGYGIEVSRHSYHDTRYQELLVRFELTAFDLPSRRPSE